MKRRALVAFAVGASCVLGSVGARADGRCGDHPWCDASRPADERADLLLGALTQDERIGLLTGGAVARLDVPAVRFTDGPVGAGGLGAGSGPATGLPAGIALAAGWDQAAALAYGRVVGDEVKRRGFDGVYGPTMNIMRTALGGRTFEAFGEDPYLASRMAVGWIRGAQAQGVMADAKHYAANNQEGYLGVPPLQGLIGGRFLVNAIVDERSLREIYFPAFEASVREGGAATVMCSYNRLNGVYACENAYLLKKVLKEDWGFTGFVVSDAGAAHDTAANLENGLDYDILGTGYLPPLVQIALATGRTDAATVDEHVHRILRTLFSVGFFDRAGFVDDASTIDQAAHAAVAQSVAEKGITLLENTGVLPLDASSLRSIAIVGLAGNRYVRGSGSSDVSPFRVVTPLEAIRTRVGPGVQVTWDPGFVPQLAARQAAQADVAIVFAHDTESEGSDKTCLSLDCPGIGLPQGNTGMNWQFAIGLQDELIHDVAAANPNTIVVLETGAPVLTPWRSEVEALLEAWYPGQEGGTAIARVLFGDVDPGGRLPATFPAHPEDIPTAGDLEKYPGLLENETYKEGVLVGYRWYDARATAPAYPFGFGLSYTSFSFHDLQVTQSSPGAAAATVTIAVTNTGTRRGIAVPQLYVSLPRPPAGIVQRPKQLKRFASVALEPGETQVVPLELTPRDFSYWDVAASDWRVADDCYAILLGASSRDIRRQSTLAVGSSPCAGG